MIDFEDEEFHFMGWVFDITQLRLLLERTFTPPLEVMVPVASVTRLLESDPASTPPEHRTVPSVAVNVEWDRVNGLPREALSSPLFVAPMGGIGKLVIDGWHRLALARRLGIDELPALLLTRQLASRVLLHGSPPLPPD